MRARGAFRSGRVRARAAMVRIDAKDSDGEAVRYISTAWKYIAEPLLPSLPKAKHCMLVVTALQACALIYIEAIHYIAKRRKIQRQKKMY